MTAKEKLARKMAGPPTWPTNPQQDSFGNPTTKKPGDVGTSIGFPNKKGKQKWLDLSGTHRPHNSRDWKK